MTSCSYRRIAPPSFVPRLPLTQWASYSPPGPRTVPFFFSDGKVTQVGLSYQPAQRLRPSPALVLYTIIRDATDCSAGRHPFRVGIQTLLPAAQRSDAGQTPLLQQAVRKNRFRSLPQRPGTIMPKRLLAVLTRNIGQRAPSDAGTPFRGVMESQRCWEIRQVCP